MLLKLVDCCQKDSPADLLPCSLRYLLTAPTKRASVAQGLFLRWIQMQDRSSEAPSIPKNVSGPVGILLKRES